MIDKRLHQADQYNRRGIGYANQGQLKKAVECFKKALKSIPNANSYYFLGLSAQKQGKADEAEKNYQQAVKLSPHFSMAHNNLGAIYLEKKDYPQAILHFESSIASDPNNSSAYNNLGNAYKFTGKLDKAVDNYRKALQLEPKIPETLNNLGLVYFEKGKIKKAKIYLKKAIAANTRYAPAHFHLGIVLGKQNKLEKAVSSLENYLKLVPQNSEACALLANFCLNLGDLKKAESCFKKALSISPNSPHIISDLGNLYKQAGDSTKALKFYQKALKLNPSLAGTYNNIGVVFLNQGKLKEATRALKKALAIDPQLASAHYHLGLIYERQKLLDQAEESLKSALKADPTLTTALSILVYVLMQECDWDESLKKASLLETVFSQEIKAGRDLSETPFLSVIRKQDLKINYQIAKSKSKQIKKSLAGVCPPFSFAGRKSPPAGRAGKKVISVGYLSHDFYTHATAHLTLRLFATHNRKKFKVFAYSYGPDDQSYYRKKIAQDCDKFTDIANLGFYETAKLIHQDGVDILVELKGHTRDSRLEICALRPAPVQVTYLGFPGTTGADFIDYLLTDRMISPPETARYYSEKLVYLPHCYQVNDNQRPIWGGNFKRSDFRLPEKAFIYSSFNRPYKIDAQTFDTWMKIMTAVPNSVLWLLQDNLLASKNLKKEVISYQIDPKRIIFATGIPQAMHLKRLSLSDLALDTFTCNGHTTTSDYLWAGVPMITLQGNHFASRVASSIITAVGLPELITHSPREYEKLAVSLAQNPKKLNAIRSTLNANRLTKPLFDTRRFVFNLEKAYELMWDNYLSGRKPKQIEIIENRR